VKRQVDYTWRLAEIMAAHGMHNSTELIPRLAERGIELSRPQVYRIVHQRPERISVQLLAALCDIFDCGIEDLLTVTATDVRRRRAASSRAAAPSARNVVELNKSVRPSRARVIRDDG
jgi:DNA-binding Xre family transcriptional regulator